MCLEPIAQDGPIRDLEFIDVELSRRLRRYAEAIATTPDLRMVVERSASRRRNRRLTIALVIIGLACIAVFVGVDLVS